MGGVTSDIVGPENTPRSELPKTIEQCKDEGEIHIWVETQLRTYTLDLVSKSYNPDDEGEPMIARAVPNNYYYLEDGVDFDFNIVPA